MKSFLTSSIGGIERADGGFLPCALDGSNGLLERLLAYWPENAKCLILSSDPENPGMNDAVRDLYGQAFPLSGLPLSTIDVCDARSVDRLEDFLRTYNVLLLAGGHVPTQNRFFQRIGLKGLLQGYEGIIIGISAGTMNCAGIVYAQPELEGEAADPAYQRYLDGLGLTEFRVLPHFQELKGQMLDGLRVLEDIALPDSRVCPFYALTDGAYILTDGPGAALYGEAYLISDGTVTKICETGSSVPLDCAQH
jgi:peptidase E